MCVWIIHRYNDETGHLIHSVTPWLLWFSSALPASSVYIFRFIQNCAARFILKNKTINLPHPHTQTDHITPPFQSLHWIAITQRIQYKINTLCKYITCTAPSYPCDCLQLYTASTLRSASGSLIPLDSSCQTFHCRFPHVCVCICASNGLSEQHLRFRNTFIIIITVQCYGKAPQRSSFLCLRGRQAQSWNVHNVSLVYIRFACKSSLSKVLSQR